MLRKELDQSQGMNSDFSILKNSFNEIEKRCVKHQKGEIDVKKQLTAYKEFVVSIARNASQVIFERIRRKTTKH